MSCIVAMRTENGFVIGADQQVSAGWIKGRVEEVKFQKIPGGAIGFAGDLSAIQRIRYELPELGGIFHTPGQLYRNLVKPLREVFDEIPEDNQPSLLVASKDHIWRISPSLGFYSFADGYMAIGAGAECAMGAIYAGLASGEFTPAEVIELAIEASSHHSVSVSGEPVILEYKEGDW